VLTLIGIPPVGSMPASADGGSASHRGTRLRCGELPLLPACSAACAALPGSPVSRAYTRSLRRHRIERERFERNPTALPGVRQESTHSRLAVEAGSEIASVQQANDVVSPDR
jgi:hypothetical protein